MILILNASSKNSLQNEFNLNAFDEFVVQLHKTNAGNEEVLSFHILTIP